MKSDKWDRFYSLNVGSMWWPDEGVVRFVARYLRKRLGISRYGERRRVRRILDAGCGIGRHVGFFAEQGLDACGVDLSPDAVGVAKRWLRRRGLKADVGVADLARLPFPDGHFDAVVSFGVLDHIPFPDAKRIVGELSRVLAGGGYLYLALCSTRDADCGRGEKTMKNTYVIQEGCEKGMIQHYFSRGELRELFAGFKVFDVELHETVFPKAFTIDKFTLQSERGTKKYLDLAKGLDLGLRVSRWHIAAEKA